MAPMKRARSDAEEVIIDVESARSNLRQDGVSSLFYHIAANYLLIITDPIMQQRKKARISVNGNASSKSRHARAPSESSSDEDEDMPEADEAGLPPATQYEIVRDGNWEHLDNQELDDQRATQKFMARRKQIGDNHAAENAIIEKITCVNFMCHDRLTVELGPLINFVIGMNGSGKSAVLTAITLCLGGKAASTNRGSSLKSLIKNNKEHGALIIQLKNQGNDAYQHDVYGDSIIIERHFSRQGTSGYKLKNANEKLVSSKKGDVDDIIEYYQLQVDNPMNVLTQDAAKTFIQTSTPKQKYKFFKEGVQLEALDNDYKLVSDTCDQIEEKLEESKDDLQALQKKAADTKARAQLIQQQDGMKQKFRNLQRQSAWIQVAEVEDNLAAREAAVTDAQEKIEQQERLVEQKDETFQQTDALLETARESLSQLQDQFAPIKAEEEEARSANDAATADLGKVRSQREDIKSNIRGGKTKVKGFQTDIEVEEKRRQDANGGAQARKLAEIRDAEQVVLNAKEEVTRNEEAGPRLEESRLSAERELKKADAVLGPKRKDVEAARFRLHELTQNQGDVMAGYDPRMPQLMRAIREEPRFQEKPVGPIGLHIKLLNPIWSHTIETVLGNSLNSFIVTSKRDSSILQDILRRHKVPQVNVFTGNRQPIDTTGHEPDRQHDTILRVLDIDDDLVRNQLIINHAIDQTILIPKRSDGHRIMFTGPKPKNVKGCLTLHDKHMQFGHRLAWTGRNQLEEITGVRFNMQRKPRMKSDIEGQLNYQRDFLKGLEQEKNQLETERAQAQTKLQKCTQAVTTNRRDRGKLQIAVQRAEDRVEKLQVELEKDDIEDGHLDALRGYLTAAEQELRIDQDAYGALMLEMEKLNQASSDKKQELESVKLRVADHEMKIKKAEQKVHRTAEARQITLREKNVAVTLVTDFQEIKARAERHRVAAAENLARFIEQASQISPRIPIDEGETVASIEAKLGTLEKRIKEYRRKQGGTDEEINNAAVEAGEIYDRARRHRLEVEDLVSRLKQSFMKRMDMYRRFQRFISCRSRINFNYLLSERAFRGKLTIDHRAKMLDVHVEPDETTKSSKGRQTKTLSGGEKSFSSICLLLALWEAMGAPLRCLDEFDVFMDDVNRDVSTRMIISAARRSVGRQFVLISPKALGAGVADAEDVKIIKLFDPRDKQRRVDEMMQED
ncbi:Structural maintenance of chromosomes protein [Lachnellula suecica]|uniref:Structural maintenance of chromosomes protein n=1 Tax=Lachnellula suecica TaxID=602035 RepID=A0A8T9CGN5_9HELO|nr:Structural maintenance of chromosomes protein [Lachnellula suecica]